MSPTLSPGPTDSLADIAGLRVGHHHLLDDTVTVAAPGVPGSGAATGCTVVLADRAAIGAVDVRGGGPGTRETDLLDPAIPCSASTRCCSQEAAPTGLPPRTG